MQVHPVVLLALVAGAGAEELPTARLAYVRGAGAERCPDERELMDAVSARLGYVPFREDAARTVSAEIARAGAGLVARVRVDSGTRTLSSQGRDCAELGRALALAISVAIDPLSLTRPPREVPPPAAPPAPAPPPVVEAPPPAVVADPAPPAVVAEPAPAGSSIAFRAYAAGVATVGATPGIGGAVAVGAGLRLGLLSLSGEGRFHFATSEEAARGRVRVRVARGAIVPCVHLSWAVGCASAGVGVASASGAPVAGAAKEASQVVASLGLRAGVEVPLPAGLFVLPMVEVESDLQQIHAQIDGDDVWAAPAVRGGLSLAFGIEP